MKERKIIVIVGPTASGKTALGVEIAKKFNGEIISADSRQVYKGLDIGTGKDLKEYRDIKYHLIDICKPGDKFTLFDWLEQARKKIDDISSRQKIPVIVGGTGLYVKALVEGYQISEKSPVSAEARAEVGKVKSEKSKKQYSRKFLDKQNTEKLIGILKKINPSALKRIDQNNPRRLVRAIEIAQENIKPTKIRPDFEALQIGVNLPRKEIYEKIDKRVDGRFKEGMLGEVAGLIKSDIDKKWLLSLGLEYKIIGQHIIQKSDNFEQIAQELKWKSHAYARRQLTWLRKQPDIKWVKNSKEAQKIVKAFLK